MSEPKQGEPPDTVEAIQMEPRATGIEAMFQLYDRYAEQMRAFQLYSAEPSFQASASTSTTLLSR